MDLILKNLFKEEIKRQQLTLDLIPSENIASPEMFQILGSPLVNKYSEGYPGKRYYPGNKFYDEIELLAQERALQAFRLNPKDWAVNVQPYSGSPANQAIYFALLHNTDKHGLGYGQTLTQMRIDVDSHTDLRRQRGFSSKSVSSQFKSVDLMGLSLTHGGHLTHGHSVNFSGVLYHAIPYTLNPATGYIDYDNLEILAEKHRPKIIISGATAYPRIIDFKKIGQIAKNIGAYHVADISHVAGLVVHGLHPSPFPYADVVMTTTHKTLRGPRGAVIFARKRRITQIKMPINADNKHTELAFTLPDLIDRAVFPGLQGGPHNNVTAALAWTFEAVPNKKFKVYANQIIKNARVLARELLRYGFSLVSGGTDNHLMLLDLRPQNLSGIKAERLLENSGIIANRNTIPGDLKPFNPSGIRIGTPAVTSRGMKEKEMKQIAQFIYQCLVEKKDVLKIVQELCKKYPLPYNL